MTTLPTRSFATIVSSIAAGMQGRVSTFLNFAIGSTLRAVAEAYAGVCLWLQGEVIDVAKVTRLSTSSGSDVDTFVADFFDPPSGQTQWRIGAVAATGLVQFSRYTASASAPVILVGATVQTQDGTQAFAVYADPTNVAYSTTAGGTVSAPIAGYIMPAQVQTLNVPVVGITNGASGAPGANGNIAAGAISLISSSIPGIDLATNLAAFTNGSDSETDPAVKIRFRGAIAGLSKGTFAAIEAAIDALQTGMQVTINENVDLNGVVDSGMLTIVCDDGSGAIPSTLLTSCQFAVQSVRAAGVSRVGVYAAAANLVSVTLLIGVAPGYVSQTVLAQAAAAIAAYVNGIGLGNPLPYFSVGAAALAVPGAAKVEGLLLNGGTADIAGNFAMTIKIGALVVSPTP